MLFQLLQHHLWPLHLQTAASGLKLQCASNRELIKKNPKVSLCVLVVLPLLHLWPLAENSCRSLKEPDKHAPAWPPPLKNTSQANNSSLRRSVSTLFLCTPAETPASPSPGWRSRLDRKCPLTSVGCLSRTLSPLSPQPLRTPRCSLDIWKMPSRPAWGVSHPQRKYTLAGCLAEMFSGQLDGRAWKFDDLQQSTCLAACWLHRGSLTYSKWNDRLQYTE